MGFFQNLFQKKSDSSSMSNSSVYYTQLTSDQLKELHDNGDITASIVYAQALIGTNVFDTAKGILNSLKNKDIPEVETLLAECTLKRKAVEGSLTQGDIAAWKKELTSLANRGCYLAIAYLGLEQCVLVAPTHSSNAEAIKQFNRLEDMPKEYCLNYVGADVYAFNAYLCSSRNDFIAAYKTALIGASYGDAFCLSIVGASYLSGQGVNKDLEMAEYYLEKSLDAPESANPYLSRVLTYKGLSDIAVYKNEMETAFKYMKLAAELGDPHSMHIISDAYRKGNGVKKDLEKAAEWEQKAVQAERDQKAVQAAVLKG